MKILITGGAGFIGSNLAHKLVHKNYDVRIVDNFHPAYGGNEHNFTGISNKIELIKGDISERSVMQNAVEGVDVIFHIAAQCSHVDSMVDPWLDVQYNCIGTLNLLEAAKDSAKKTGKTPLIIYAGTRAQIGQPLEMPAHEKTYPNPVDVYGVNKLSAELYGAVYARVHAMPFISLRLTNCYGPRHQMKSGKYGILNWFISLALQGKPVKVFGTGEQLRDYLYIDDAMEVFVKCMELGQNLKTKAYPKIQLAGTHVPFAAFNIGSGKGIQFVDAARKIVEKAKSPIEFVPWTNERKSIETGDFVTDTSASTEFLNWKPTTSFDEGLDKTFAYYEKQLSHYL